MHVQLMEYIHLYLVRHLYHAQKEKNVAEVRVDIYLLDFLFFWRKSGVFNNNSPPLHHPSQEPPPLSSSFQTGQVVMMAFEDRYFFNLFWQLLLYVWMTLLLISPSLCRSFDAFYYLLHLLR